MITEAVTYLRPLVRDLVVGPTYGTEAFTSSGCFPGGVSGEIPSRTEGSTPSARATIFEMSEDGIFAEIFGSLGEERERWQESQAVQFFKDHRDKLFEDAHGAFFELHEERVAYVTLDSDGLPRVVVYLFSLYFIWLKAGRRVVVLTPQ